MRFLLCILIMAVSGISALADDDYYPLHVGDQWTMTVEHVSRTGKVTHGIARQTIRAAAVRMGKVYFRCRFVDASNNQDNIVLVRKTEKGVYTMYEEPPNSEECIELSYPLKPGLTWHRTFHLGAVTITYKVVVVGLERVKVPPRIYKGCYHIRSISSATGAKPVDSWFAPGIGFVKSVAFYEDGTKRIVTLKKFKPGN